MPRRACPEFDRWVNCHLFLVGGVVDTPAGSARDPEQIGKPQLAREFLNAACVPFDRSLDRRMIREEPLIAMVSEDISSAVR